MQSIYDNSFTNYIVKAAGVIISFIYRVVMLFYSFVDNMSKMSNDRLKVCDIVILDSLVEIFYARFYLACLMY